LAEEIIPFGGIIYINNTQALINFIKILDPSSSRIWSSMAKVLSNVGNVY
jgi:hypothetical protein